MVHHQDIASRFQALHHLTPIGVRAPGRINLIGEHTDYNHGFVMPGAIDKAIYFAMAPSSDEHCSITSLDYDRTLRFSLTTFQRITDDDHWGNYPLGVLKRLLDLGMAIKPFHCLFGSNIPAGAGMSSSAALECGFLSGLRALNDLPMSRRDMALIAQWSENNFVGANTGIMDQYASLMGKSGHVLQIDCRSLDCEYVPMPLKGISIVLLNSGVHHSLAGSEYNVRRQECQEGVQLIQSRFDDVESLRDITLEQLGQCRHVMPERVYRRCQYILEENDRVIKVAGHLKDGNLAAVGKCMLETHIGLSKLFEISCPELDFLVNEATLFEGLLGARLMGGGFGGCTINLVRSDKKVEFIERMRQSYQTKFSRELPAYEVTLVDGCELV